MKFLQKRWVAVLLTAAMIVAATAAEPPMSEIMFSILAAGLMEMPPVSKVMPLPTSATVFFDFFGVQVRRTRRGPREEPCPTARMPP